MILRRLAAVLALSLLVSGCVIAQPSPSGTPVASPEPTPSAPAATFGPSPSPSRELTFSVQTYPLPAGSGPHDVAPAADGGVWYTAQRGGALGWLDPETAQVREIPLGPGSQPHGVIVGPDGAPWITDSGLNAIVRVDPETDEVTTYRLPASAPRASLNTATFDDDGVLWFTGQSGIYGSVDPAGGAVRVFAAPRGPGPYGIATTPSGEVFYASLAGSYLGRIDRPTGQVEVIDPPTAGAGLRRVWSDSTGRLWTSEWFAGQVGVYDPDTGEWQEWPLPGGGAQAYAVYVDETDAVWLTDFAANAIVRFDPRTETFMSFVADSPSAEVRQLLGRRGEVWGAESRTDRLVVVRFD